MIDIENVIKRLELLHDRLLDAAKLDAIAMFDVSMVADAISLLKQYKNLEERHATMVDAADKLYAELRSRPQIIYCEECAFFDGQDGSETHSRCGLRNCDTNGLEFCSMATRKKEN